VKSCMISLIVVVVVSGSVDGSRTRLQARANPPAGDVSDGEAVRLPVADQRARDTAARWPLRPLGGGWSLYIYTLLLLINKKHLKNVGPPIRHYCEPPHAHSPDVATDAACASMSATTITCNRGDRYRPMEWAQLPAGILVLYCDKYVCFLSVCLSVCLSVRITREPHIQTSPVFCAVTCSHQAVRKSNLFQRF